MKKGSEVYIKSMKLISWVPPIPMRYDGVKAKLLEKEGDRWLAEFEWRDDTKKVELYPYEMEKVE